MIGRNAGIIMGPTLHPPARGTYSGQWPRALLDDSRRIGRSIDRNETALRLVIHRLPGERARVYSGLMPRSRMILPQRAFSLFMKTAKSSGALPTGSAPSAASCAFTSGVPMMAAS